MLIAIAGLSYLAAAPPMHVTKVEFTADGKLKLPDGYREWVYVGGSVTPNDLNGGHALFPEFHSVYIDPESFADYQKTGEYRDGTVMVKELPSVGGKEESSGKGYFMGKFNSLEVSIKDSKRFKDEPGKWAYFSFGHKYPLEAEVSISPTFVCNKCHQDSAQAGLGFHPELQRLACVGSTFEVKRTRGHRRSAAPPRKNYPRIPLEMRHHASLTPPRRQDDRRPLLVAVLVAAMIALVLSHPSPADDSPRVEGLRLLAVRYEGWRHFAADRLSRRF